MLSLVANNPFRILGVTSEATLKTINAAQGKMRALATIGRKVEMPLDLDNWLPAACHDAKSLEAAKNTISLKSDRLKAALYWWINAGETDNEALRAIGKYDFGTAVDLWEQEPKSFSARFNLATLRLLTHDPVGAIEEMAHATDNEEDARQWLTAVGCDDAAQPDTLFATYMSMALPLLSEDETNQVLHSNRLGNKDATALHRIITGDIHDQIVDEVARCSLSDDMGYFESREALDLLRHTTLARLDKLKEIWGSHSQDYQLLADKVARTLSECAIRFHNKSFSDIDRREAMRIQAQAAEVACSPILKQKFYKDVYDIEGFQFGEPLDSLSQHTAIVNILETTDEHSYFSNILEHLLQCALPLCQIYDMLGIQSTNEDMAQYFKYISSRVASHFGHQLLEELNRLCSLNGKQTIGYTTDAWLVVKCLQKLQLSEAYKRFEFNDLMGQIMGNPIMKLNADDYTEDDVWSTAGLFDFGNEEDVFINLHTGTQYDLFIKRYPSSRHTARIKEIKRQKELEEQAAREADDHDWETVTTAKQARTYLAAHPRGAHADEARSLIEIQQEAHDKRFNMLKRISKRLLLILAGIGILIGIAGIIILIVCIVNHSSLWNFIKGLGIIGFISLLFGGKLTKDNDKSCGTGCIVILVLASLAGWLTVAYSCAKDYGDQREKTLLDAQASSSAAILLATENVDEFDFNEASNLLDEHFEADWAPSLEEKYDAMVHANLDSAGWDKDKINTLYDNLIYLRYSIYTDTLTQRYELINRFGEHCYDSDEEVWHCLKDYDTYDAYLYYTLLFPNGRHTAEAKEGMKEHTHMQTTVKIRRTQGQNGVNYEPYTSIEETHD